MDWKGLIVSNPNIRGGQLVIVGTRVPVSQLFAELADGQSVKEIAEDMDLPLHTLQAILLLFSREYAKIPLS